MSFEIFPPKRDSSLLNLNEILYDLKKLKPDFISITFGAGGNSADITTCEIANIVKQKFDIEPLIHLTCMHSSKKDIVQVLNYLQQNGLNNILALRGDINPNITSKNDFKYASDLISFIKGYGDFNISAACYPEGHIESSSLADDILHLKEKIDSGASHLISQLFFDNDYFYSFVEKVRFAGINVPIEAGIMPVVNKKQIERMVSLCGASIPLKLQRILNKYENQSLRDAGIAYATEQIADLISHNVEGIHLYTMNNPRIAEKICEGISSLI